ncbi:hypothetical protein FD754_012226, partial [Muntiacus muntjak]
WLFGGHSPSIGLSPTSSVELVPIFPHVCTSALPLPVGKSWIDKRIPNCKIFVNNSFALDSTWVYPEESRLFHGHQKPQLWTNQVAVSLSRPTPASRPLPTVVLAPQPPPGYFMTSEFHYLPCNFLPTKTVAVCSSKIYGLPFPPPRDLPDPGIKPASPVLAGRFFTTSATWKPLTFLTKLY